MKNNWLHKYGANSKLYNVAVKGLWLSWQILIWASPVCYAVIKSPSAISIYLSVSTSDPGIKFNISGVMWQFSHESKI